MSNFLQPEDESLRRDQQLQVSKQFNYRTQHFHPFKLEFTIVIFIYYITEQFHGNFVLRPIGFRKLGHSSEMQSDALMHSEGLNGKLGLKTRLGQRLYWGFLRSSYWCIPETFKRCCFNVGQQRCWPNKKPTLFECHVFAGIYLFIQPPSWRQYIHTY